MPIYRRCGRCNQRILSGSSCTCRTDRHKEYDKYSRDKKAKAFYASSEWLAARARALELDEGIDVYLFMTEGKVVAADTVHHIVPLRDDWEKRIDPKNLMSLSHETHSSIEKKYKDSKGEMIPLLASTLSLYRSRLALGAL